MKTEEEETTTDTGELIKVVIEKNKNGTWNCTRTRKDNGERATGLRTLEEAIEFIRSHGE